MNTKFLVFLAWMFNLALLRTADEFWRFCLIYAAVMAICTYFYNMENKTPAGSKKKNGRK